MRRNSLPFTRYALPVLVFGLFVLGWQEFVDLGIAPGLLIPSPKEIVSATISNWELFKFNIPLTIFETLVGFAIGFMMGTTSAVAFLWSDRLRAAILPYALATSAVPIIVFAPIVIVFLGFGAASKIVLVALIVFFPSLIQGFKGLSSLDPSLLEMAETMAASDLQVFFKIRLPNALPYILAGLRITVSLSLVGAIVGEYFGSERGLGFLLMSQLQVFNMPMAWATMVFAALLGTVGFLVVVFLERRALFWSHEFRHIEVDRQG